MVNDRELTNISEDLQAIKGINEVYAGDLMLHHAINKQTEALRRIEDRLVDLEAALYHVAGAINKAL